MQYVRKHETCITSLIVVFMVKRIAGENRHGASWDLFGQLGSTKGGRAPENEKLWLAE